MEDLYQSDFEFLDLSNLDDHGKDELTAILKPNSNAASVQLPWVKEEINYHVLPVEQQVVQHHQEEPKVWSQYEIEGNVMKYEQPNAASSILLTTVPPNIPYSPQIMAPVFPEWPNIYMNNIASDPHHVHSFMAYSQNIYAPNNDPVPQDMSSMRDGGRRGRGRSNKNYSRNINHSHEIPTGYTGDHNQYQLNMQYPPYAVCISEHAVTPQPHHAAGQPIYFPTPPIYNTLPMAQQTHRVDYIQYHQSPTNTKHNRQSQSISSQTNGESTKSTNHKSYGKKFQNINILKPSIHQSHNDNSNSSRTNIVTTVIVNNSNVESSIGDADQSVTASNNTPANKKFGVKIEHNIVSTINENCSGTENNDMPCVNIKSSIEVNQNGNDKKDNDETISQVKAPVPAAIISPVTSKPLSKPIIKEIQNDEIKEIKKVEMKKVVEVKKIEVKKIEEVKKIDEVKEIEQAKQVKEIEEVKQIDLVAEAVKKVEISQPIVPSTSAPAHKPWASLFKKGSESSSVSANKLVAFITPNNTMTVVNSDQSTKQSSLEKTQITSKISNNKSPSEDRQQQKINATVDHSPTLINNNLPQFHCDDPTTYRMGEFLLSHQMEKQTVSLLPRGLTNRSNYCYINSILQALLACPPFYNLFMAMPYSKNLSRHSHSPLINNMIKFVREFSPLPEGARLARKDRAQKRNEDAVVDIQSGVPFEPSYMYTILKNTSSPGVFSVEGRQEDAEEFLSCLLNGISDEMLELMKLASSNEQKSVHCVDTNNVNYNHDEEEWKVMGPKNKGSITRSTDFGRTPLSDIFRGQLRSRVQRASEQATDYVQPFFTLQLEVEKAESVKSAFEILVGKDPLEGMTCSKTKQQIEAWKQVLLEELPVILILHLKWFDYKPDGCSKILKSVEFPIDLKIDHKLMSMNARPKLSQKQRQYKLFAVTYHDGKEATKGHYITDAFHVGYGGWVRYDDSSLKGVSEANVLKPLPPRVPYLLYYRRCDTIGNNQSNNVKAR